jgi:GNAT superfamily N-acetyltransferase
MRIIDVTPENVDETGFFCLMSRRDSAGWHRKRRWLDARFAEGLHIKMLDLDEGGRGFIEYIPGEFAWRPVEAGGWIFIHCLWVVGKSKGKGYATMLLEECIADARRQGANGVAMVTSEGNWLAGRKLLLRHGFDVVDRAAPTYELLVKTFEDAPPPTFSGSWDEKARSFGKGFTIVRTDQCPYLDDAVTGALEAATHRGLATQIIELTSARAVREEAPSPYGVFSIVLDGVVLSHHPLPSKKLIQLLANHA